MPNLMCNHLIIHGKNAVEIMRSVLSESEDTDCGYEFDFEKIKPMPQELDIPYYGLAKRCARLYINSIHEDSDAFKKYSELFKQAYNGDHYTLMRFEQPVIMQDALAWKHWKTKELLFKNEDEVYACGKQALDNFAKYGFLDLEDWREHNWGTKWNAYETQINDMEKADIYFNTAGSPVPQLIQALSEKYPDHKFEYEFAEETPAIGSGYYNYENGIAVSFADYPDESKEAYEMFFALFGMDDEFKFNPKKGTYEPIDAYDADLSYNENLINKVNDELEEFKEDILTKTPAEIYNEASKIRFYEYMTNYINGEEIDEEQSEALFKSNKHVLAALWDKMLDMDNFNIGNVEDADFLIEEYLSDNEEQM